MNLTTKVKILIFVCVCCLFCECSARRRRNENRRVVTSLENFVENLNGLINFYLYTRTNHPNVPNLNINDHNFLNNSLFDNKKDTKILIHGFRHDRFANWIQRIRSELVETGKWNVIVVDWSSLSNGRYPEVRKSTRLVGKHIATLCDILVENTGISLTSVHLIGHSLGAHVAGYAGASVKNRKIGRITGLDPARPLFEMPSLVTIDRRLDWSDANFVDVIHTNGGAFGMILPIGHVDFYPNGGMKQPGCDTTHCNHNRSCELWTNTIKNPDMYQGYLCNSYEDFVLKKCVNALHISMGINTDTTSRGIYFFDT